MTQDRFDKFTDRARKVLSLAQDEAQRFGHNYIGTEHLLLGLIAEGEGLAARVLEDMDVELAKVRTAVEFVIGRGDRPIVGEIGLTPRAKRTIELAIDEARRLGHNYLGTEHLLLGLIREGEGIAAGVLESLGCNLAKVRETTIKVISSPPRPTEPKRPSKTKAKKVSKMTVRTLPPDSDLCRHEEVYVDEVFRRVNCTACGEMNLDPFTVLLNVARKGVNE